MRSYLVFLIIFFLLLEVYGQGSKNIDLLGRWDKTSLQTSSTGNRYSDCFGIVYQGKEYGVIGSTEGTHIIDLNSDSLFEIDFVRGKFSSQNVEHRDYSTYQNLLYAVCDEGASSLQIIDLSYLPDSVHLVKEDSVQFGRVHNIFIDSTQKKLYSCIHRSGGISFNIAAPMKIFDLSDPINLIELYAGPDDVVEVHDIFVEDGLAYLNCGFDGLRVYNFSNTNTPVLIQSLEFYNQQGYNHQGWRCPSKEWYVFADETADKRIKKCKINPNGSLTVQSLFGTFTEAGSIPHNIMCSDTFVYIASYNQGLRIYDLRQTPPEELAYFDSHPGNYNFKMRGNWGVYTLLPSKRILISDRQSGLFLLKIKEDVLSKLPSEEELITVYPNPSFDKIQINLLYEALTWRGKVYNAQGKLIYEITPQNSSMYSLDVSLFSAGLYQLEISYVLNDEESRLIKKIVKL